MEKVRKPNGYWNFERCKEEALKFTSRTEFNEKSASAYNSACIKGWLETICSHMISERKSYGYWTIEHCHEEALKYSIRSEFREKSSSAYSIALKKGWLEVICNHMIPQGSLEKRFIYKVSFPDGAIYIGLTCNFEERKKKHLSSNKSSVYQYMILSNSKPTFEIISDLLSKEEAAKLESKLIKEYKESGFNVLNRDNGGGLGGDKLIYIFEHCQKEALKYSTKQEFRINSNGAYRSAERNKWLDEICSHMISIKKANGYWNFEKCLEEVLKYNSKTEFYYKSRSAYNSAKKNKWIDEFFPKQ